MSELIVAFAIVELLLLVVLVGIYRRHGLSLFVLFYIVHFLFISSSFFIFYGHVNNVVSMPAIDNAYGKLAYQFDSGARPLGYLVIFHLCYLGAGFLMINSAKSGTGRNVAVSGRNTVPRSRRTLRRPKYTVLHRNSGQFAAALILVSVGYTILRLIVIPDFPLFQLFSGGVERVRDASFEYASNTSVPWVFLPSINKQFYRILLPLGTLLLYTTHFRGGARPGGGLRWIFYCGIFFSIVLNLGSFKRAPIIYLLTWFLMYFYAYQNRLNVGRMLQYVVVVFGLLVAITSFYGDRELGDVLVSVFSRVFLIEGMYEYAALNLVGEDIDYFGASIISNYFFKILQYDVMTLSEYWKLVISRDGARGYASIGVMGELYTSYGVIPLILGAAAFGVIVCRIDLMLSRLGREMLPFVAGLMTVIAFSAIKGIVSQTFSGGAVVILITLYAYRFYAVRAVGGR